MNPVYTLPLSLRVGLNLRQKQSSPPSSKPTKKKGKEEVNLFTIIASTLGSAAAVGVLYYLYKNREAAPCNSSANPSANPSEEVDV